LESSIELWSFRSKCGIHGRLVPDGRVTRHGFQRPIVDRDADSAAVEAMFRVVGRRMMLPHQLQKLDCGALAEPTGVRFPSHELPTFGEQRKKFPNLPNVISGR